ncbi:MAG: diguanylate cyclase [Anaerolineales bacterium]|nr:diguanylate cyclase [Anaerolineales bacterium]
MNPTYASVLFFSTLVALWFARRMWQHRRTPEGKFLLLLIFSLGGWSFFYGLHWLTGQTFWRSIWMNLTLSCTLLVPPLLLLFLWAYINPSRQSYQRFVQLLLIEPVLTLVLLWTDPLHGLFYHQIPPSGIVVEKGVWFGVNSWYNTILLTIALITLGRAWMVAPISSYGHFGLLFLAVILPVLVKAGLELGLYSSSFDFTPASFIFSYISLTIASVWTGFPKILPISRAAIFDRLSDLYIVLDSQDRIVDINPAGLEKLGAKTLQEVLGKPAQQFLTPLGLSLGDNQTTLLLQQEITLSLEPLQVFDVRITPLYDGQGRYTGRLLTARDVSEQKKAQRAEREQRRLSDAVRDILNDINLASNFDEVFNAVLDRVGSVVPFDMATFLLLDDAGIAHAVCHRGYDSHHLNPPPEAFHLPLNRFSTLQRMVETQSAILIPDTHNSPDWIRIEGLERIRSYIGAPMSVRGKVIGFLDLISFTPNFYRPEHAERLQTFAAEAAIGIENFRLLRESQERAEQMKALFEIGMSLTSGLERDYILKILFQKCRHIVPADAFYVALVEPDTNTLSYPLFYDGGYFLEVPPRPYLESGLCGQIIQTRQSIYLPDVLDEQTSSSYPIIHLGGKQIRSYVGVPMVIGERVIGVLSMQSYQPNAYSLSQVCLLETIASQAAIALENARLFQELSQRVNEMLALFDIGLTITSGLNLNDIIRGLFEKCRQVLNMDAFYIAIYDEKTGMIEHPLVYDLGEYLNVPPCHLDERSGLSGHVIRTRKTLYLPDTHDPNVQAQYKMVIEGRPARSYLGTPMLIGNQVVGVISIQSYTPYAYGSDEIRFLETIALQAAIAIQNSRLYAQAQKEILDRRLAEQRYRALFEQSHDAVMIVSFENKYLEVNWRAVDMLGYSFEELLSMRASDIYAYPAEGLKVIEQLIAGEHVPIFETTLRKRNGEEMIAEISAELVYDLEGRPLHIQTIVRDITERKRNEMALKVANTKLRSQLERIKALQAQLREQAIRDPLTGLYNRRFLEETLQREFALARRHGTPISLLMLDIDNFKQFNDTYGHDAGDFLLKELALLLQKEVRSSDICCRYGGEEFVVIMPGAALKQGLARAQRLRQRFEEKRFPFLGKELHATLSIGVACYPKHGTTWEQVIQDADQALYKAKSAGKNCIRSA